MPRTGDRLLVDVTHNGVTFRIRHRDRFLGSTLTAPREVAQLRDLLNGWLHEHGRAHERPRGRLTRLGDTLRALVGGR